jgi:2-hydroxy-3-keto-5-methylthiopentenyl-1-phosphate phosphatase
MTVEKIAYVLDFDGTVTEADLSAEFARLFGGDRYRSVQDAYRRREFGMK